MKRPEKSVKLRPETHDMAKQQALNEGVFMNELIHKAMTEYINKRQSKIKANKTYQSNRNKTI